MVIINIEELLKKNNKSKYWLCCQMNMTSRNINRIIRGETTAISFKYIDRFSKSSYIILFLNLLLEMLSIKYSLSIVR